MSSAKPEPQVTQQATMVNVAEHAGVSIKTVSRVLNCAQNGKPATRAKVKQAMEALGYRPNSPARMLAGNRTYLVGLIYNASSGYITSIQNGVLCACRPEHYDLLIHPCSYTAPSLPDQIREFITPPRVDGLILVPPVSDIDGVRELVHELGIPSVVISGEPLDETDWAICTNDREISKEMVRHLYRLGHQSIAFVRGHPAHKAMDNRYRGYLDGMAEAEINVDESIVVQGENTFESGIDCGIRLMRRQPRPTAVFCANDHMAAGVIKVAHERKLEIPRDLSVTGFDDLPIAEHVWPQLTTIRQPLEPMAQLAASQLIGLIRNETPKELRQVIESQMVVRQSTGPAPTETA